MTTVDGREGRSCLVTGKAGLSVPKLRGKFGLVRREGGRGPALRVPVSPSRRGGCGSPGPGRSSPVRDRAAWPSCRCHCDHVIGGRDRPGCRAVPGIGRQRGAGMSRCRQGRDLVRRGRPAEGGPRGICSFRSGRSRSGRSKRARHVVLLLSSDSKGSRSRWSPDTEAMAAG